MKSYSMSNAANIIEKVLFLAVSKMMKKRNVEKRVIMLKILECPKTLFYRVELSYKINKDILNKMGESDYFYKRQKILLKFSRRLNIILKWRGTVQFSTMQYSTI